MFSPVPKPSHNRRVKKRVDRGKFSKMVRDRVKEHYDNTCQECFGKGIHLHHVCFRSQGGRGVFSNSLLVCNSCHKEIHNNNERAMYWKEVFKKKYGSNYYRDKEDLIFEYKTDKLYELDEDVQKWLRFNDKWGRNDEDMFC